MVKNSGDIRSVKEISSLLSKKWRLKLLCALRNDGPCRFSGLKQQFDISSKVLTDCLNELVDCGIIERTVHSEVHITYSLTEAGTELLAMADELGDWSARSYGRTAPTILIVDDNPRLNNLFADLLSPEYNTEQVIERHRLEERECDETDLVVFHHKPHGSIDTSSLRPVVTPDCGCGIVVVASSRRQLHDIGLHYCGFLTVPVVKKELRALVECVLDCRALENA